MPAPNIPNWTSLDHVGRANAVLEWCWANGIETASILEQPLAAAMQEAEAAIAEDDGVQFESSPADYIKLIRVIAAFLRARP